MTNIAKKAAAFSLVTIGMVGLSSQLIAPAQAIPPLAPVAAAAAYKIIQMPCMQVGSCVAGAGSALNRLLSAIPQDRKVYWRLDQREILHAKDYVNPAEGGAYACKQIVQPKVSRTYKRNAQYVGVVAPIKWPSRQGERVTITCVFADLSQ
jgi:hypothetical protein